MTRLLAPAALFALAIGGLLWIAAEALAAASERAVTYSTLAEALGSVATPVRSVSWAAPARALDRAVTPADEVMIGRAISEAWQALAVAQSTGRTDILVDGFTGIALARAERSVEDAVAGGGRIAMIEGVATPVFFHLDGSVFQAEMRSLVARYAIDDEDAMLLTEETGIVTLMNESSGWRVFSYELRTMEEIGPDSAATVDLPDLRGVNYYPAETPWRDFWPGFDDAVIAADLDRIADLGGTTLRIFLPREGFGDDDSVARLEHLLHMAETRGMAVVPTLFDRKGDYGPGGWASDAAWLRVVLPVLEASDAVAFIDLKNEPDLDFETHGQATVTAWLGTMAAIARIEAPGLPLSVGWSAAESAPLLADTLDVISYHDYAPVTGTADRLAAVRAVAGGRPVVVSEIGASSYELALGRPGSPEAQAAELADRLSALAGAEGVLVWTLHDFPNVDASAVGSSPWVRRLQSAYGLLGPDGAEKPAAMVVRRAFADRAGP